MSRSLDALRRHWLATVGIIGFLVVSLTVTLMVAGTLAGSGLGKQETYRAIFRDANGLDEGDDIRISGVRVGAVQKITLREDRRIEVEFSVKADQPVYQGSTASIDFLNLLGQRYIDLAAGTRGDRMPAGGVIPLSRTYDGLDLTALFNAFRPLFESIRPEAVNELALSIAQVLEGQHGTLSHLTAEVARLTQHLVDKDEVIGAVITNLGTVTTTMADHRQTFRNLMGQLDSLVGTIAANRNQIGETIVRVQQLSSAFGSLLEAGLADINRDVSALLRWAESFAKYNPRLAKALKDTQVLVNGYTKTLGMGSFLNTYVCDSSLQFAPAPPVPLELGSARSWRCR